MLANPTTLILGAGASHHLGYPTGAELREWIIEGRGLEDVQHTREGKLATRLANLLQRSLVSSIDAFLAEPEQKNLEEIGTLCITAALLPCELAQREKLPGWYQMLFNAIRGRLSSERTHKLKIVTFNYDLSLEHALFHAFMATYNLDHDAALQILKESVEFIHVYGQLGSISELEPERGRQFGEDEPAYHHHVAKGIKIIGREPDAEEFKTAQEAIRGAEFLGILGFGYDQTNVANLKLKELAGDKHVFSTGYNMGYGMRGWIRSMGLARVSIGAFSHDVMNFLHYSGFLQWANTPGATSLDMRTAISSYLGDMTNRLPDDG